MAKDSNDSLGDSSSSETSGEPKKRRVREDFRAKYAYLDAAVMIDLRGLGSLADDVRSSLEILKNSYLAIVNSLIILNDRKKNRTQEGSSSSSVGGSSAANREVSGNSNFMSSKVAENFRQNSAVEGPVPSYPDTGYDWSMDKFCDPATRDATIALLFEEADKYTGTVKRVKLNQEPINMARFVTLVHQGKSLLGIIDLLNSNYSNNFLDIFRIC